MPHAGGRDQVRWQERISVQELQDGRTDMETYPTGMRQPSSKEKAFSTQTWMSAAGILVLTTLLSKALGFLRDVLVAKYFGTGEQVDAFMVAVSLPVMIGGIGLALSTSFIPMYRKTLAERGLLRARSLAGWTIVITVAISSLPMLLIILIPEYLIGLIAPTLPVTTGALAIKLARWLSLLAVGINLFYVFAAVYNAVEHFKIPAFSDLMSNVCVLGALLLLSSTMGISALSIGIVGGYLMVVSIMVVPILSRRLISFESGPWNSELRQLVFLAGPICCIEVLSQVTTIIENYFGASVGSGAISALGFARRLMLVVVTLLASNIARAVFPTLSRFASEQNIAQARGLFHKLIHQCLVIFVPISILFMYFRDDIIRLVYMRGAFDTLSVANTSTALLYYSPGIVPLAILPIFMRTCYAFSDSRTPLMAALVGVVAMIGLDASLTPILGIIGIALSSSLGQLIWLALMGMVLARRLDGIDVPALLKTAILAVVSGVMAIGAAAGIRGWVAVEMDHILALVSEMGVYCATYVCVGWLLMQRNMRSLWTMARRELYGTRGG